MARSLFSFPIPIPIQRIKRYAKRSPCRLARPGESKRDVKNKYKNNRRFNEKLQHRITKTGRRGFWADNGKWEIVDASIMGKDSAKYVVCATCPMNCAFVNQGSSSVSVPKSTLGRHLRHQSHQTTCLQ
jgi:predicted small metal-binding protein